MAFMKRVRLDDELISQGICADRADASHSYGRLGLEWRRAFDLTGP